MSTSSRPFNMNPELHRGEGARGITVYRGGSKSAVFFHHPKVASESKSAVKVRESMRSGNRTFSLSGIVLRTSIFLMTAASTVSEAFAQAQDLVPDSALASNGTSTDDTTVPNLSPGAIAGIVIGGVIVFCVACYKLSAVPRPEEGPLPYGHPDERIAEVKTVFPGNDFVGIRDVINGYDGTFFSPAPPRASDDEPASASVSAAASTRSVDSAASDRKAGDTEMTGISIDPTPPTRLGSPLSS